MTLVEAVEQYCTEHPRRKAVKEWRAAMAELRKVIEAWGLS